tara:strand:+ start:204 stop:389 length:186 start_codon:yes stop_codon:yes gene_type:complete
MNRMFQIKHAFGCPSFAFPGFSKSRRPLGFPESSNAREAKENPLKSQGKAITSEAIHLVLL